MIDWQKRLELQAVLNEIRTLEKIGKSHASLLPGKGVDFLLYIQYGMMIGNEFAKNLYTKMIFEISRQ